MTKIINEKVIKDIAEIAAENVRWQYPKVDYLVPTVRTAVIDAANKVFDLEIHP